MSELTPAEELELAADILEARGKTTGRLVRVSTGEVCALGAIGLASGISLEELSEGSPIDFNSSASARTLGAHLVDTVPPSQFGADCGLIALWQRGMELFRAVYRANDGTKLDMAHEMRMAAKKWRADHE
jgi:hypothetical protein